MDFSLNISTISIGIVCLLLLYKYIIFPVYLSPLAKIPNAHFTSSFSSLWILWRRFRQTENRTIYQAHEQHGPVVRLGRNEISVNCVDGGIRTIYAGGFEKHEFYSNLFTAFDGTFNMFSMTPSKPHSARKRMLSNVYSKSYLQSAPAMAAISQRLIHQRLLPKVQELAAAKANVDVFLLLNSTSMDFVTAFKFGLSRSSNFIQDEKTAAWWLDLYHSRRKYLFWPQEMTWLLDIFSSLKIPYPPKWVGIASAKLDDWCLNMCNLAEASTLPGDGAKIEDTPTVYQQLRSALVKSRNKDGQAMLTDEERAMIGSELVDHIGAGHETSAITMTYLFHELSQRPKLQQELRKELLTLSPPILNRAANQSFSQNLPSAKSIDSLPLLHALIMETLRLHPAIPGPQPRITPKGAMLGANPSYGPLPANVRVSAQPYSLHRNSSVFPSPEQWLPERWLEGEGSITTPDQRVEMHKWFWAFGSGGRMCIGSNLAIQQMKLVTAAVYTNHDTTIVDDRGIEQEDGYTALPKGHKLILKFQTPS